MSCIKHILETFKHINTNFDFSFCFSKKGGNIRLVNFTGIHVFHMFLYSLLQQSTAIFFPFLVLKPLILISRIMWQKVQREIKTQNRISFGSSTQYNIACEQVLGALWRRGGKRKESLQLRLRNLNICIEKVDTKCRLADMTLIMTLLPLALVFQCLFTFTLVSAMR